MNNKPEPIASKGSHVRAYYDAVIVGGSLAGSAAAIRLAQKGWNVAILERDTFPRNKLCGEFLSGESHRLLNELGCLDKVMQFTPPEITHMKITSGRQSQIQITLPQPAFGISRLKLDDTLFNHAIQSGAAGITGCVVKNISTNLPSKISASFSSTSKNPIPLELETGIVIAAYGRRTGLDYILKRRFTSYAHPWIGFKRHYIAAKGNEQTICELSDAGELHCFSGGYCGVSLVEDQTINICMLLKQSAFKSMNSPSWPDLLGQVGFQNLALGSRIEHLLEKPEESMQIVSRVPFGMKEKFLGNIFFIGDAAGMIAPLCGDGQAMALESGILLADLLTTHNPTPDFDAARVSRLGANWSAIWKQRYVKRIRTGLAIQSVLTRPISAQLALRTLSVMPESVSNYLARITRG